MVLAGRTGMASLKTKGGLAELKVAADLVERGYRVAIPFGEDCDFDLILCRADNLERVQVKYTHSNGEVITLKCYSHSLTNGRIRQTKCYTARTIDWLAVYDRTSDRCYYVPASELGEGRKTIHLRLKEAKNCQRRGIRFASDYCSPEKRQLSNNLDLTESPT
jgi:PD-(D/E)XK endonuclease